MEKPEATEIKKRMRGGITAEAIEETLRGFVPWDMLYRKSLFEELMEWLKNLKPPK